MSERYKCGACGGEYSAVCADGLLYFHRCPPTLDSEGESTGERPGARDENIAVDAWGRAQRIKAEGLGRVIVAAEARRPLSVAARAVVTEAAAPVVAEDLAAAPAARWYTRWWHRLTGQR